MDVRPLFDGTNLAWIICILGPTIIFSITFSLGSLIEASLEHSRDKELPERLERFKLEQFKDGVEAVKLSISKNEK